MKREKSRPRNDTTQKPRYCHLENAKDSCDLLFLGESHAQAGLFNESLSLGKARIYNRGVYGDTTLDIANRINEVLRVRPKELYLMAGINDLRVGRDPQDIARDIDSILGTLKRHGVLAYIQKTIQCAPFRDPKLVIEVERLNWLLQNQYSDELAGLGELNNSTDLCKNYTYDRIHLNSKGYSL